MLLTTGIVALSRKVKDEKARRREARQALLKVGDSEVAKKAFQSEVGTVSDREENESAAAGTEIKYHQPADVVPLSGCPEEPVSPSALDSSAGASTQEHDKSLADRSDIVELDEKLGEMNVANRSSLRQSKPSPYSARGHLQSALSPSVHSQDSTQDDADTRSSSTSNATVMTGLDGVRGIRVRTKGADLKSGFQYQPELFDLHIRPDVWERFTAQVIESTKFSFGDNAQMVAAATATAMTGAVITSFLVARSVNRSLQESKVRNGLEDMSDGGLGDVLKKWNETELRELGLFAHVELSKSAIKRQEQGSRAIRKPSLLYSRREDRERKQEERKFCIVVTKLDEEGVPTDAIHELSGEAQVVEAPNPENVIYDVPELPDQKGRNWIELAAADSGSGERKDDDFGLPQGYAELESPVSYDSGTCMGIDQVIELPASPDEELTPAPLMVTAETHAALNKETM